MSKIKSLADQLRDQMAAPVVQVKASKQKPVAVRSMKAVVDVPVLKEDPGTPEILTRMIEYDSSDNKSMIHVKLDENTAKLVAHFKMATGVDNIKLGAFAIRYLFDTHPELKTYIKNFIQNLEL